MKTGILDLKGTHLFFIEYKDGWTQKPVELPPGTELEIELAQVWIPGRVQPEYEESREAKLQRFVTKDGSYCGFSPGMGVRLISRETGSEGVYDRSTSI